MFSSNLIIGLGGQGGRSVAAFLREMKKNPHDEDEMKKRDVRIEYLYVDSSEDQLKQKEQWMQYGQNVSLPAGDVVNMPARSSLSALSSLSNISPWLGNLGSQLKARGQEDGNGNVQNIDGAGQLRRYGRALFADYAATIGKAIDNKLNKLCDRGVANPHVCIHVFCTLGGGTGSGGLIDLLTMINQLVRDHTNRAKVMLYCYVAGPATKVKNSGYFFENEYAALRDLNALACGTYHPFMTGSSSNDGQVYFHHDGAVQPINQIYISSEYKIGTDIQVQIEHMARACFQMIATHGSLHPDVQKGFTGEDLIQGNPGETPQKLTQSYRFAGVAAKSWFIPISKIKEMLKLGHEARVCKLWLSGKEADGVTQSIDQLANNYVVNRVFSNGYQTFLSGLIDEKKEELMDKCTKLVKQGDREADTLNKFAEEGMAYVEALHNQPFTYEEHSQASVKCRQEVESIVQQLRTDITRKIQWQAGVTAVWGLKRAQEYVDKLMEAIQIKGGSLAESLPASKPERVEENLREREEEWGKLGILSRTIAGLDETMIRQHCQDIMYCLEPILAYAQESLQKDFYNALVAALEPIKNSLTSFISIIEGVQTEAEGKAKALHANLQNVDAHNNKYETYEMDAEMMGKVLKAIEAQDLSTYMVSYDAQWQKYVTLLNQGSSKSVQQLLIELSNNFYLDAEKVHNAALAGNDTLSSLLVGSILERLAKKAGFEKWDASLPLEKVVLQLRATVLPDIVKFLSYMPVSAELKPVGNFLKKPQMAMQSVMAIGFPDDPQYSTLAEWMQKEFESNLPSSLAVKAVGVYRHTSPEVIRIMYVPHWFPARFATVVDNIYSRYMQSAREKDGVATLYFANLDDEGAQIPPVGRFELINTSNDTILWDIELAKKLTMKNDKGEFFVVLDEDPQSGNMAILDVSSPGSYGAPYDRIEKKVPSPCFKGELTRAMDVCISVMSDEQKKQIEGKYEEKQQEARARGVSNASDEGAAIQQELNYVRKKLGI